MPAIAAAEARDRPIDPIALSPCPSEPVRLLAAGLCLIALWPLGSIVATAIAPAPPAGRHCVDANAAPWWELALLPQLGVSLASSVVAYRESTLALPDVPSTPLAEGLVDSSAERRAYASRVFESAVDLTKVRGIGPTAAEQFRDLICVPEENP